MHAATKLHGDWPEDGRGKFQRPVCRVQSSGASPELIASNRRVSCGEELLHYLNRRSLLPAFWQVAEVSRLHFRWLRKVLFCCFCEMRDALFFAFVDAFVFM